MSKDLYKILEIEKTATQEEITKKYKKMAKQYHPDKNNGDPVFTEKFKDIAEAFEILTDPKRKQIYDTEGYEALSGSSNNSSGPVNPLDLFAQVMQSMGVGMGMGMGEKRESFENVVVPIDITLEDLYTGKTIFKSIERKSPCKYCAYTGTKDKQAHPCEPCDGSGQTMTKIGGNFVKPSKCAKCSGSGINELFKCAKCVGIKYYIEQTVLNVQIPSGAYDGMPVILRDSGNIMKHDISTGETTRTDAIFVISEKTHGKFKRSPDRLDLYYTLDISFGESLLGFTKTLTHLDNSKFTVQINEPSRHEDKYIVKQFGMPEMPEQDSVSGTKNKGNLIINIVVEHPKEIKFSSETKNKLHNMFINKPIIKPPIINLVKVINYEVYKEEFQANEAKKHYDNRNKQKVQKQMGHASPNANSSPLDDDDSHQFGGMGEFMGNMMQSMMNSNPENQSVGVQDCATQ